MMTPEQAFRFIELNKQLDRASIAWQRATPETENAAKMEYRAIFEVIRQLVAK